MQMTQDEKRIKLAEAGGWKNDPQEEYPWQDSEGEGYRYPPDYFYNLNAVHELEKVLLGNDIETWLTYDKYLAEGDTKFTWHTTATQRAEALGLTLKLWE